MLQFEKKDRQYNDQAKRHKKTNTALQKTTNVQTTLLTTLVDSGASERYAVPAALVAPVMLQIQ